MKERLLITGANGFTGRHLVREATAMNYEVCPLEADLTDKTGVAAEVAHIKPSYAIHLAAISAVTHSDLEAFYRVNVFGSANLLEALENLGTQLKKAVLASSANVYGKSDASPLQETFCAAPINHYGISKYAMERLALSTRLPVVIARPFNYTGVGHDERFVIPKLVRHFITRAPVIELGDTTVMREYNDVRSICSSYLGLLEHGVIGESYNLCSGNVFSLDEVIGKLETMTGHIIDVKVNPAFLRQNEIAKLYGSPEKLERCLGKLKTRSLENTLSWMLAETAQA